MSAGELRTVRANDQTWNTNGLQIDVRTEDDQPIELTRRLGAGGQGEVWQAAGGRIAVKVLHSRDQQAAERLAARLRVVRQLDLDNLPLARPLTLLKPPHLGYTMAMLADMVALRQLVAPSGATEVLRWYTQTGGLRRRLRLLGRAAAGLSGLHARGLCYGDPSPVNVMVSAHLDREHVYLIDVDNIAVMSEVRGSAYVTPGYAAPEVLTGRLGVSSLSDAFAFGVMAFETLAVLHPFIGDLVYDGEPELEERAFAGELPWVDHPTDPANRATFGHARDLVLTPGLRALAARTFEAGLADPAARPTVGEWRTKLYEAADMTLTCSGCSGSYLGNQPACPWCAEPAPPALLARVFTQVPAPGGGAPVTGPSKQALLVQQQVPTTVSARTAVASDSAGDRGVATLWFDRSGRLTVANRGDRPMWVVGPGGGPCLPVEPGHDSAIRGMASRAAWELHFGPTHEAHRLLRFDPLTRKRSA